MNRPHSNLYHLHMLSHSLQQLSLIIVMCNIYSKVYRSKLKHKSHFVLARVQTCACAANDNVDMRRMLLRVQVWLASIAHYASCHQLFSPLREALSSSPSPEINRMGCKYHEVTYVYFLPGTFIQIVLSIVLIVSCRCSFGSTLPLRFGRMQEFVHFCRAHNMAS